MDTTRQLRDHLIATQRISATEYARAQHFAQAQMMPLTKALITLSILDYANLGSALAEIHGYPYYPLLTLPASEPARALISRACATHWQVAPVSYDPYERSLTLAASAPERMLQVENAYRFLMQPQALAFTVASDAEIEQAIIRQYDLTTAVEGGADGSAGKRRLTGLDSLVKESRLQVVAARKERRGRGGKGIQPPTPTANHQPTSNAMTMSLALVSAVRLLILRDLAGEPARIQEVQTRVRYAQLLATRLQLGPAETEGTILATWMSAFRGHADELKQLQTPYPIEEILVGSANTTTTTRMESMLLSLILSYQALLERDPESRRDVGRLRNSLRSVWSAAPEHRLILETFLQLLMDEEFLTNFETTSGCVLIVDQAELRSANLAPPLTRQGYSVTIAPDIAAARKTVTGAIPDLILLDADLPTDEILGFIGDTRKNRACLHTIIIAIADPTAMRRASLFMRAGADDVLSRPVDLELLLLKLQRLLPQIETPRSNGVQGSLTDMSFPDMLQILCAGGKSAVISLEHEGHTGSIHMQGGNVVHAVFGNLVGEPAFHELMGWTQGRFTTQPCENIPAITITTPTMSLLLESARHLDERAEAAADPINHD